MAAGLVTDIVKRVIARHAFDGPSYLPGGWTFMTTGTAGASHDPPPGTTDSPPRTIERATLDPRSVASV